ncbi:MAG: hypothetical protein HPY62_13895, partial [Bacteroidales bacterium]|nr:hypothetical protein [Bacteroidales bacterium]
ALRFTPDNAYMMKMMAKNFKKMGIKPGAMPGQGMQQTATGMNPGSGSASMGMNFPSSGNMPAGIPSGGAFPAMPEGTKMVWMKDGETGIRPVFVTVGIENGSNVEILSGLNEGDEVLIAMSNTEAKTTSSRQDQGPRGPFPF